MSVPYVNNSKNNHENRLDDNEKKKDGLECKWMDCNFIATDVNQLASHAQETHVDPMKSCDIFVCLWQHCKVFNRPSCSLSWLTKHLESHVGVKPFKCIFEGCQMSFSTQTGLARHVPCHFKENLRQTRKNIGSMEKDESPSKRQLRKKGKVEDFVDQHSVNSIKSRLQDMISTESNPVGIDGSQIHFVGQPLGERLKPDGVKEILLRWIPESILPDEWVSEKEARTHARRSLPIHRLPNEVKAELHPSFYRRLSHRKKRRK
ncbi:zinc finger protein AEBP2-like [Xenia sp. Carnegie-2017]|uniref:zinc finger protein AEBP2-like n=1 Tax=Xenia sp. Carnegie-2017 TaxID=2897299 RepID=UPI001F0463AB|nr:zinc finger protein AEBP2-like [Xenia sp. Carnegie-2017]